MIFNGSFLLISALYGGIFTFVLTGLGSFGVFFLKKTNPKIFSFSLGMAGGIMMAASFWSLLNPAIEIAKETYTLSFVPVVIGFILGIFLLRLLDLIVPHLHLASSPLEQEGPQIPLKKSILIFLAITIHNIPEGLAIGVSFGSVGKNQEFLREAYNLTLGIGIQNIPEGLALSLALKHAGLSRIKSFFYGFLSAIVEPIFALTGVGTTLLSSLLLPYALSLAAGAMIFVTIEELLPEAQKFGNSDIASLGFGIGFLIMMVLDTFLG
jgi:ZIP family zinc transporter